MSKTSLSKAVVLNRGSQGLPCVPRKTSKGAANFLTWCLYASELSTKLF